MRYQEKIIRELADSECRRITRKAIRELQRMSDGLQSGDDSGLINIWDEVCVQVQHEYSIFWWAYEDTIGGILLSHLEPLPEFIKSAIWLQTEEGEYWEYSLDEGECEDAEVEYSARDLVDYIFREYLLSEAADWSNKRINDYMERLHWHD